MRTFLTTSLVLAAALAASQSSAQQAAAPAAPQVNVTNVGASINITPKRVTFDSAHRNGTVFILNQGATPVTVDVTLVDRIMMPDGQIITTDDAGKRADASSQLQQLHSARDLLQVAPRRVTLAPGKGQNVRVRLGGLPTGPGEYRSHLTVTTIPPRESGTTAEEAAGAGGANALRFQINAVYGVSIPVIVRNDAPQVAATLTNPRIEYVDTPAAAGGANHRTPLLALDVVRTGASSLYGNLDVRPVGAKRGSDPIGIARGVGVYTEVDHRVVRIPLSRAPNTGETLEVTFTDDDTSPGKVLAKTTL